MADGQGTSDGIAGQLVHITCMGAQQIEGLSPEQKNALHQFKFGMVTSLYELYTKIPQPLVDGILFRTFQNLEQDLAAGGIAASRKGA